MVFTEHLVALPSTGDTVVMNKMDKMQVLTELTFWWGRQTISQINKQTREYVRYR